MILFFRGKVKNRIQSIIKKFNPKNKTIDINLALPDTLDRGIIIYTTHKAGSMFVYRLLRNLCEDLGYTLYSINESNFPQQPDDKDFRNIPTNCLIGPIRYSCFPERINEYRIVLHIRDPRDVLVSMFYSWCYSHERGKSFYSDEKIQHWIEMGIDNFVIENAPEYVDRYSSYVNVMNENDVTLIKYEEMVLGFPEWVEKFLTIFPINNHEYVKNYIVERYMHEFKLPIKENKYRHKRRMLPGDHKEKLKRNTVKKLNELFSTVLKEFQYAQY